MSCPGGERISKFCARTAWEPPNVAQKANAATAAMAAENPAERDCIIVFMWYSG